MIAEQPVIIQEMSLTELPTMSLSDTISSEEKIETPEPSNPVVSGGYLTPPSVIYEEEKSTVIPSVNSLNNDDKSLRPVVQFVNDEDDIFNMHLVEKSDVETVETTSKEPMFMISKEMTALPDEEEEQKRKAAERLHKLRNLSYNSFGNDLNQEFDSVPAYVRRNLELYSTISPAENFYSNYTVKSDENNQTHLSTLNTFLDGNKPD